MIQLLEIGLVALLLFFVQQYIYRRLWNRNLKADLTFSASKIFEGEQGNLYEVVENHKRLPLPMLKVKFHTSRNLIFEKEKEASSTDQYYRNDVFRLGGGEKITRSIPFIGGKRGFYQVQDIDLAGMDLFFTVEMLETVPVNRTIYVYPKPFDSKEFQLSLKQLNGEIQVRKHLVEDPFEYLGIRDYQPFDDVRSIHWKATAKTGDLKVIQRGFTSQPSVRIFFNIEDKNILKKDGCVEACFQIAAGLSKSFIAQGIRVSCFGNGLDIVTGKTVELEAGGGNGLLEQIYRALARVDETKPAADFNLCFGEKLLDFSESIFTFIISPNQYDPFVELLLAFQDKTSDFLWLYPVSESEDPSLPKALEKHIQILHI